MYRISRILESWLSKRKWVLIVGLCLIILYWTFNLSPSYATVSNTPTKVICYSDNGQVILLAFTVRKPLVFKSKDSINMNVEEGQYLNIAGVKETIMPFSSIEKAGNCLFITEPNDIGD